MILNKHEQERKIAESAAKKPTIKINIEKKTKTNDAAKKTAIK